MNSLAVIDAFRIPESLKVSTRVIGRTVFRQNAALPPADARIIESSMTDMKVVATIRPAEFMIPAYVDDVREYLEILLVRASVKAEPQPTRLQACCIGRCHTRWLLYLICPAMPFSCPSPTSEILSIIRAEWWLSP